VARSGWFKHWCSLVLNKRRGGQGGAGHATSPASDAPARRAAVVVDGAQPGWLRVLPAADLLAAAKAQDALDGIWRQSRLASQVWERDLLPAVGQFAEFVQLMPASESHHHAHPGGLLVHTVEMLLASLTWRNGHFLPESACIEQIDAERDAWTYVVFFAALLHDIAKPMTDLRITWRAAQMPDALRWTPIAGSLVQIGRGRLGAEYRVEFTPKSLRDYGAHSRLALTILHQVAPASALSFLARTPHALDVLTQYLSGQDKSSLVAQIVRRADQASTARALLQGSRARFDTATSIPLIELLMNAMKAMLRSGTELPLNRSGAAGWVHDGSVWFVAKRVADAVRAWIRHNAPDESIPGDSKNDRLFDTWQEYGCIQVNPASGQAIWYVAVQGRTETEEGASGEGDYSHNLTMLRFPLARLYDDEGQYPPAMLGHVEIKDKRPGKDQETAAAHVGEPDSEASTPDSAQVGGHKADAVRGNDTMPATDSGAAASSDTEPAKAKLKAAAAPRMPMVREPGFNKPKAAASQPASPAHPSPAAAKQNPQKAESNKPGRPQPPAPSSSRETISIGAGSVDGFGIDDGDWLDDDDDVKAAATAPVPAAKPAATIGKSVGGGKGALLPPLAGPISNRHKDAAMPHKHQAAAIATVHRSAPPSQAAAPVARPTPAKKTASIQVDEPKVQVRPLLQGLPRVQEAAAMLSGQPDPVLLVPKLPELPQDTAAKQSEPSETAVLFMRWLQQGLASREIKYNESGAPVHFTEEGMALVSPLIFKLYARENGPEAQADAAGLQIQREVIKAGWHRMNPAKGSGRVNILRYDVQGRGGAAVGKLSAVVLTEPARWVLPVPPANPVLKLV